MNGSTPSSNKAKSVRDAEPELPPNKRQRTAASSAISRDTNGSSASSASSSSSSSSAATLPSSGKVNEDGVLLNTEGRPWDWPSMHGELDLAVHDLPHDSSDTEWWYVNGHVKTAAGKEYSFFVSFFRIVKSWDAEKQEYTHAHALNWAIIDVENKKYYADPILDPTSPALLEHQFEADEYDVDSLMKRAFLEVVKQGNVPGPDRMFTEDIKVAKDKLDLDFGTQTFVKDNATGEYVCSVHCKVRNGDDFAFDFRVKPQKKPIRHGHGGVVKIGLKGDDMFYYFIPRCDVTGKLTVGSEAAVDVSGTAWYDHEFGGTIRVDKETGLKKPRPTAPPSAESSSSSSSAAMDTSKDDDAEEEQKSESNKNNNNKNKSAKKQNKLDYAWNWLSVQLDDGSDITATTVVNPDTMEVLDNFAVVINPDSSREEYLEAKFTPQNEWMSVRTTSMYPTKWRLSIPAINTELDIEAAFVQQEFITLISKPAFWEGRMHVSGTFRGQQIKGLGFVERHGFQRMVSMDKFFKKVSGLVRKEIANVLPLDPTSEQIRDLMASKNYEHIMDGVDPATFVETMIKPIRTITDRGGKSWRSYALLLCVDAVGGSSFEYQHWLAMPEIMHVGSLIVDDIQDESETRRGGPTAHKLFGDAIAINAGTAAYFLAMQVLEHKGRPMTQDVRLKMYDTYFLTLRAGHAGQAFDINGLNHHMPEAVASGDASHLIRSVVCTHRLKSAVPAGALARMGCIVGGGSDVQIEKVSRYFESVGIAFQIMDDVLNLRGLPGKTKGEDLMMGKVTFPVALAMDKKRIPDRDARAKLWAAIEGKPQDQGVVNALVDQLEECGALPDSVQMATDMVEAAWKEMDAVLPDSFYKLNMRVFGWYVLKRHY
eukprot:TRINITY_DN66218_c6_g1_i1.p2 TRINITY_DN66218_c6_g1~~TRINITY_DN66218_c6_g1_i1.p2  ORF type:complete len:909 (+),score=551.41 TRINITY_DN66218_c6_g1_i1:92-2728(+)